MNKNNEIPKFFHQNQSMDQNFTLIQDEDFLRNLIKYYSDLCHVGTLGFGLFIGKIKRTHLKDSETLDEVQIYEFSHFKQGKLMDLNQTIKLISNWKHGEPTSVVTDLETFNKPLDYIYAFPVFGSGENNLKFDYLLCVKDFDVGFSDSVSKLLQKKKVSKILEMLREHAHRKYELEEEEEEEETIFVENNPLQQLDFQLLAQQDDGSEEISEEEKIEEEEEEEE
jgi:hypothetical protein